MSIILIDILCVEEMYKGIEEANEVMRFNIVQGSLKEDGNYGKCVRLLIMLFLCMKLDNIHMCL